MPTLQERAAAGEHLNADEVGKLLDINFPQPALTVAQAETPPTGAPGLKVSPQPTYPTYPTPDANRPKKLARILLCQILVPKDRRALDGVRSQS